MYVMLCLAVAFVYFQLGDSWKDVFSRAALLFFVVAFLTFMSIAAFPAFVEDMKVSGAGLELIELSGWQVVVGGRVRGWVSAVWSGCAGRKAAHPACRTSYLQSHAAVLLAHKPASTHPVLPAPPPVQVFVRERLNGYYGVSHFTVSNTLASLPFIFLISVVSTVVLYW
jgi:hypothetical protein